MPDPDDGHLANLVRAADDAIFGQTLDGTITSWNIGAQRIYGYAADEILGTNAVRFVPPDRPNDIGELLARIGRGETVRQYETVHYSRDARRLRVVLSISPILDSTGTVSGAVTVARGAGEVSEYEATRLAAEERFRGILDVAPVALMIVDERGRIEFANPRAALLFGYDRYELMSTQLVEVLPERVWSRHRDHGESAPDTGPDAVGRRRDGSEFPVELGANALTIGGRRLVAVAVVDLSARHHLEEQLLQAQKMESVGRLAGGVAHDFNNLLTGIFGYTSLLAEELGGTSADARELLQGIRESAERAAALTAQLLAFSRRQVLQPRVVELNDVVRGIEPLLRRIIGETISLVTIARPEVGRVRADPTQLEQVIVNLVVNARDAMPDGGTVVLETDEVTFDEAYAQEHFDVSPGRYAMLAVTDSGVGMDAETRLHLFEPFFTTKDQGKGTGLGLATTYGIVKQSGGHIWLYSEPGHGTTFKLYFPRVALPTDVATSAAPAPVREMSTGTILLVEDDPSVREITRTVLARHGYTVLDAENGNAAIALSERYAEPIALLITDVVMPGIGGRALAERIQRKRPDVRTLFISGYTEDGIVRQGVLDPNVSFLAKPFAPEMLARTVREILTVGSPPQRSRG